MKKNSLKKFAANTKVISKPQMKAIAGGCKLGKKIWV